MQLVGTVRYLPVLIRALGNKGRRGVPEIGKLPIYQAIIHSRYRIFYTRERHKRHQTPQRDLRLTETPCRATRGEGGKDPSHPGPSVPIDSPTSPFKALVPGLPTYYATHDGVLHYNMKWASPEYDVP